MKSKKMRWAGHVACERERRNTRNILILKPEGRSPIGRQRRRKEDSTGMDLREIVWEGVEWMRLAQDSDQWRDIGNTVLNLLVP
jgi:hypothetical protein